VDVVCGGRATERPTTADRACEHVPRLASTCHGGARKKPAPAALLRRRWVSTPARKTKVTARGNEIGGTWFGTVGPGALLPLCFPACYVLHDGAGRHNKVGLAAEDDLNA